MNRLHQKIRESAISRENQQILFNFERYCLAEGLSLSRRWKLLEYLYVFATRYFKGNFKGTTRSRIWDAVFEIEASDLAPWTKHDFKVAIRKLFKFVEWGNDALMKKDYPDSVAAISIRIKKKDQVRIQASDILSEKDVDALIAAANNSQAKAIVSMMYELGARVGEIGTMRIGSISRDQYSYICDLNGKTGPRSVRVVQSAGALTAWLNLHPRKSDTEAALWGLSKKEKWIPLAYYQYQRLMKSVSKTAGIKKRVHPHLLRHSRITHVLANGQMNEAQAKVYFGLVADSKMLATYSHLLSKDANNAVLRMNGISIKESRQVQQPSRCGMCGEVNDRESKYCARCGYSLKGDEPYEAKSRLDAAGERITKFLSRPEIDPQPSNIFQN